MNHRRPNLHRFFGIEDTGKLFVIDLDQLRCLFCDLLVNRRNSGNSLVQIPYLAHGERRLIPRCGHESPRPSTEVFRSDDCSDAWQSFGLTRVDIENLCVYNRTAQYFTPEHVG